MSSHDTSERARRIERVRKLLAVARDPGATEHEAATALAMAQRLMEEGGISDQECRAHDACENQTERGTRANDPPKWENGLAGLIGRAFACDLIFHMSGRWSFIGIDPLPEVAAYAFDVLHRQLSRARRTYIAEKLKRVTVRANKVRRADLFCDGWVAGVAKTVNRMARRPEDGDAIKAYVALTYPSLTELSPRDRNASRNLRDYEHRDWQSGRHDGQSAELNTGVGVGGAAPARIGTDPLDRLAEAAKGLMP
ncbi:DUF2786 domain-containing protein [Azospirillum sp. 11R-A]|uniref:DUF2786 domain-containing protein n=1 Tax=Azospirillum sp. 11R-A TaxID=3111634 RepID=UPI003C29D563